MISKNEFDKLESQVIQAIESLFDSIKKENEHDYLLFLIKAENISRYPSFSNLSNPYVIDYSIDRMIDRSRLDFMVEFLKSAYSFSKKGELLGDPKLRIPLELMIYTHIWESKPFLKQLYRLALLASGDGYPWEVEVPDWSKHTFIRQEIRDIFSASNMVIGDIISNGYHSSLRNAFAHSDYYLCAVTEEINLTNYKGDKWELKNISFKNWTIRFIYSILLSFHLENFIQKKRSEVPQEFDLSQYSINIPSLDQGSQTEYIVYNADGDSFSFVN